MTKPIHQESPPDTTSSHEKTFESTSQPGYEALKNVDNVNRLYGIEQQLRQKQVERERETQARREKEAQAKREAQARREREAQLRRETQARRERQSRAKKSDKKQDCSLSTWDLLPIPGPWKALTLLKLKKIASLKKRGLCK